MFALTAASNEARVGLASLAVGLVVLWIVEANHRVPVDENLTFAPLTPGLVLQSPSSGAGQHVTATALPRETYETVPSPDGGRSIEVVWQKPAGTPKGVIFLAHGCSHSAIDWWDKSDACPTCIGLPEEKRVVAQTLAAGLVTVAISSEDRDGSRCWNPSVDGPRANVTLDTIIRREGFTDLPLFVLGASSGGGMAASAPRYIPNIKAVGVMIMAVPPAVFEQAVAGGGAYPPVIFLHMPRDEMMGTYVVQAVTELKEKGKTVREVLIEPRAVEPHFFSDRIQGMSPETSEKIAAALKAAGLLDDQGFLKDDPRETSWREALAPLVLQEGSGPADTLEPDGSAISEELNVAWASHELSSDVIQDAIAFFFEAAGGGGAAAGGGGGGGGGEGDGAAGRDAGRKERGGGMAGVSVGVADATV